MSTNQPEFSVGADIRHPWRGGENHGRWLQAETWGSLLGGSALAVFGMSRKSWPGAALAAAGGFLIYHGANVQRGLRPIDVRASFTIGKPVEEIWRFWRDFTNLPRFMTHLQSVQPTSSRYSHWIARAPMGREISWHAEILEERENEFLVWRSLPGSEVQNTGSVEFRRAPGNRGTEIHVTLQYRPPAGRVGHAVASLFGESAQQQVREDLRHFKQLMEAGETPTTEGQPYGPRSAMARAIQRASQEPEPALPRTA